MWNAVYKRLSCIKGNKCQKTFVLGVCLQWIIISLGRNSHITTKQGQEFSCEMLNRTCNRYQDPVLLGGLKFCSPLTHCLLSKIFCLKTLKSFLCSWNYFVLKTCGSSSLCNMLFLAHWTCLGEFFVKITHPEGELFSAVLTKTSVSRSSNGFGTWNMLTECGVVWLELCFTFLLHISGTRAGLTEEWRLEWGCLELW